MSRFSQSAHSAGTRFPVRTLATLVLGGLLPLCLSACGGESRIATHPVSGKVSFAGEVPEGAQIVLHPKGHALPPNVVAQGRVAADGTFKIGVYEAGDGAPAGDYVATVEWLKVVAGEGGAARGPNVLPREYADPERSPVKVTVKPGQNELPPIEIARK